MKGLQKTFCKFPRMSFVVASPAKGNKILNPILLPLPLLPKLRTGFDVVYVLSRCVTYLAKNFGLMGVSVIIEINTDMVLHYSNPSPSTNLFSRIANWCRFTISASFISSINSDIALIRVKATSGLCPSHSAAFSLTGIWN